MGTLRPFPTPFEGSPGDDDDFDDERDDHLTSAEQPRYLKELILCQMMGQIRDKHQWWTKVNSPLIVNRWKCEMQTQSHLLTPKTIEYGIQELKYWASQYHSQLLNVDNKPVIMPSSIDGIWQTDHLLNDELHTLLCSSIYPLENIPERDRDYHPGSNKQVVNLVHPSLYCYRIGNSHTTTEVIPLHDTLRSIGSGLMTGESDDKMDIDGTSAGSDADAGGTTDAVKKQSRKRKHSNTNDYATSNQYAWLPAEFQVSDDGKVSIQSYINNLHPMKHQQLYHVLERIFERFIPLFESTLTDLSIRPYNSNHRPVHRIGYHVITQMNIPISLLTRMNVHGEQFQCDPRPEKKDEQQETIFKEYLEHERKNLIDAYHSTTTAATTTTTSTSSSSESASSSANDTSTATPPSFYTDCQISIPYASIYIATQRRVTSRVFCQVAPDMKLSNSSLSWLLTFQDKIAQLYLEHTYQSIIDNNIYPPQDTDPDSEPVTNPDIINQYPHLLIKQQQQQQELKQKQEQKKHDDDDDDDHEKDTNLPLPFLVSPPYTLHVNDTVIDILGELYKHGYNEMNKAVKIYIEENKLVKNRVNAYESLQGGLVFTQNIAKRWLLLFEQITIPTKYQYLSKQQRQIYLSTLKHPRHHNIIRLLAVVEYLTAELCEIGSNVVRHRQQQAPQSTDDDDDDNDIHKPSSVDIEHIRVAIKHDADFNRLYKYLYEERNNNIDQDERETIHEPIKPDTEMTTSETTVTEEEYYSSSTVHQPEVSWPFQPRMIPDNLRVSLSGRHLQVIVKLSTIELTPESPSYGGGVWHVEGMKNESIVSSGIYYIESTNISESRLSFRQNCKYFSPEQDDSSTPEQLYGLMRDGELNQELGSVITQGKRAITFPNIYQHQVQPFQLLDQTKPGRRKILVFFLVDPSIRIPSTVTVPPQQRDWLQSAVGEHTPAIISSIQQHTPLVPVLIGMIVDYMGGMGVMDYDEACLHREKLMKERKFFTDQNTHTLYQRPYSFCEH